MLEVIPGILEKDWNEIERKIEIVKTFATELSSVAAIHIDIIDGKFAPNATFIDPLPFKKFTSDLFFEVHLMVEDPIKYLKPFADAGFKRFLGHIEKMPSQEEFVAQGQLLGEVGLALDGPTDLSAINIPYGDLDSILIYTAQNVGFSGPSFMQERLEKVRKIREQNKFLSIEIDGGVNDQTILTAKNAGATRFAATSFLFNSEDPNKQYQILQEKLKEIGGEGNG